MSTAVKAQDNSLPSGSVVNGIDTDAVHALIESVAANPEQGMTHWQVASTWQGGTHSRARVDSFAIGGANVPRRFASEIASLMVPLRTPRRRRR